MSDQLDGTADVAVAEAVAQAVREGGHRVSAEPRRVQGMVNDVLGAQSRTRRAEVDAVVLAAEESVPEDLLTGRVGVDEAVARLHARGLDEGVALFAIDVWRYALGMLGSNSEPPSLRTSMESTSQPAATDPMPMSIESEPVWAPVVNDRAEGTVLPDGETDAREPAETNRSKPWWLIGAAAAAIVALVAGLAVVAGGGDGDEPDAAATTNPSTTTDVTTTTTVSTEAMVDFASETTPAGELVRSWEGDDTAVVGSLTFTNRTEAAISGTHFEVIPASMAPQASAITSTPEHTVVLDTTAPQGFRRAQAEAQNWVVISYVVTLEPGSTTEVAYRIDGGAEVTPEMLDAWKSEQEAAAAAFVVLRDTPPTLAITTPPDMVFTTQTVDITGTTDPTATLTFLGNPVPVNADGTWTMQGDLPPGPSTLEFVATNRFGTASASASLNVSIELPVGVDTTIAPTTTTRQRDPKPPVDPPTDGSTTTTTTPTTTTTTPTTTTPTTTTTLPPPPPPPEISVSMSGPSTVFVGCRYIYTLNSSGFVPTYIAWYPSNPSVNSVYVDFYSAGAITISATATAPDGRTRSASKYVNVLPPPPGTTGC